MQTELVKAKMKNRVCRLGGVAVTRVVRVKDPANFATAVFSTGELQRDVADHVTRFAQFNAENESFTRCRNRGANPLARQLSLDARTVHWLEGHVTYRFAKGPVGEQIVAIGGPKWTKSRSRGAHWIVGAELHPFTIPRSTKGDRGVRTRRQMVRRDSTGLGTYRSRRQSMARCAVAAGGRYRVSYV